MEASQGEAAPSVAAPSRDSSDEGVPLVEPERDPIPLELEKALEKARAQLKANELADAENTLEEADALAGEDFSARLQVAWVRAALHAYRQEYDEAARTMSAMLPEATERPTDEAEFWLHNALMMIRQAQGSIAAALIENEEATAAGRRAEWRQSNHIERKTMVALKEAWHRAYLLRMLAERQKGEPREATLRYARAAKARFTRIAKHVPGFSDSIAVLDGYFAALDGDEEEALAAAKRVDVANNGDAEGLYLTAGSFVAGGDIEAAKRAAEKIEHPPFVYLAVPIMTQWLERDMRAANNPRRARFTPFHPKARL